MWTLYEHAKPFFENKKTDSKEFQDLIFLFGKERLRKCYEKWRLQKKNLKKYDNLNKDL